MVTIKAVVKNGRLMVVTDMISLARSRAIADAVLVTGDEDIRVGVQQAQEAGVRVHLVGIKPTRENQSNLLLQEADATHEWDESQLGEFLKLRKRLEPPPSVELKDSPTDDEIIDATVSAVIDQLDGEQRGSLQTQFTGGMKSTPRDIDRNLLLAVSQHCGQVRVSENFRRLLRDRFRGAITKTS